MPKHWMTLTTREGRVGLAVKLEQHRFIALDIAALLELLVELLRFHEHF